VAAWQQHLADNWAGARFGRVRVHTTSDRHRFVTDVTLGGLDPDAVRVELYADGVDGTAPTREPISRGGAVAPGAFEYVGEMAAGRPAWDHTPRLIGHHPGASVPLEAPWITWAR